MFREVLMSPDWRLNEGIKGYSTRDMAHVQGGDVKTGVIAPGVPHSFISASMCNIKHR